MAAWRYRCPEGHAGLEIGVDRFRCWACSQCGDGSGTYDKSELVDLASEGSA